MDRISVEIKAKCADPVRVRKTLKARRAVYRGLDHQVDTYLKVPRGRLKLREGDIENALIYYKRVNQKNSKKCNSLLWKLFAHKGQAGSECLSPMRLLKKILEEACGILAIVEKRREIFYIGNVKFHIDRVKKLGNFAEIEAFGPERESAKLKKQCEFYQQLLGISKRDLLADSYSDQLLRL